MTGWITVGRDKGKSEGTEILDETARGSATANAKDGNQGGILSFSCFFLQRNGTAKTLRNTENASGQNTICIASKRSRFTLRER